ncbi:unnamed protein product [Rotaria magnacalcarata]|uniref:G-protein coupled receptors family 1 profile domain-containing protein n=2 Tax=Rotaria magnacalcarata TaxID=392030 RepID=A0A814XR31_9BILA|nr:unnamed protein product [Rotaria magnacalcarata]CAF1629158.1 unnamed protein product [Rotaria magnacalcarata]CAF2113878.1 unnamed protein product [Rotaria magnacalcarata]CAF4953437.1 unnamed protein product [Rotaria magnacalcarata]CAF5052491.1 unnamed protein product [Rotaria magnacalcarata]
MNLRSIDIRHADIKFALQSSSVSLRNHIKIIKKFIKIILISFISEKSYPLLLKINMSSSSYNESLIELLHSISTSCDRYVAICIFLFGVVGNMLNICVLSQRTFCSNSCAWAFLVSSIANLISIVSGLFTRIINGWAIDPASYIGWICKIRAHVVFTTRTIALWLIVIATIDRWLLSSIDANRRRKCTLKNAQRWTTVTIIFSILLYAQMFYCYEANLANTSLKCNGKTDACLYLTNLSFAFITILIPLFLMSVFGLLTISNVRQSQRRLQSLTLWHTTSAAIRSSVTNGEHSQGKLKRKADHSLLRMLLVQVLLMAILTLPLSIQNFYSFFSRENKSAIYEAIDYFSYNTTDLIYFVSNGIPFYIYTLCGGLVFRKALYDSFELLKQKIMCHSACVLQK